MSKLVYEIPSMKVVKIQTATMIAGSEVSKVNSSATGIGYGGGGAGVARARQSGNRDDWDEE